MSDSGFSVASLLGITSDQTEPIVRAHLNAVPGSSVLSPVFGYIAEVTSASIASKLNFDLVDALIDAFAMLKELREYADPAKVPEPGEETLHYGKTKATVDKQIDIDIGVDQFRFPAFQMTVRLTAEFKSVALHVQKGKVIAIGLGPAVAKVALVHNDKTAIGPVTSPELAFKPRIHLAPPLMIGVVQG